MQFDWQKTFLAWLALSIMLLAGCQGGPKQQQAAVSTSKPSFDAIADELSHQPADASTFAGPGPFATSEQLNLNFSLRLKYPLVADLIVAKSASEPHPLMVMIHGNHSRKEAHRNQARHLASWGVHTLVVQAPNTRNWMRNGKQLSRLLSLIAANPDMLPVKIDTQRIFLGGHSFGGSASVIAAFHGAPVQGLVLLDPAVVHERVGRAMLKVEQPVVLLGADRSRFKSRRRTWFYKYIQGPMIEVSVSGATHDDAQDPSMHALHAWGFDPFTSKLNQKVFRRLITAAVMSLATQGNTELAWSAYKADATIGILHDIKRRPAQDFVVHPEQPSRLSRKRQQQTHRKSKPRPATSQYSH